MDKDKITVTMPMIEYESLVKDARWWKGRYSDLKNIILKYVQTNRITGSYFINESISLARDIEKYLNDEIDAHY